jgi:S1-C subfamily serine protease
LLAASVVADSPADRAGIKQGMIIAAIDGNAVDSHESWLKALTPGKHMIKVWDADAKRYREIEIIKTEAPLGVSILKRETPP